jgi:hypothetical protein
MFTCLAIHTQKLHCAACVYTPDVKHTLTCMCLYFLLHIAATLYSKGSLRAKKKDKLIAYRPKTMYYAPSWMAVKVSAYRYTEYIYMTLEHI